MNLKTLIGAAMFVAISMAAGSAQSQDASQPVIRIAELEIDPAQFEAYSASVKEEMDVAIRIEPGVLALYAVSEKNNPYRLTFFEMYANEEAYLIHRDTPHFKKYVETTKNMITSRKLIETKNFQLSAKPK